MNRGSIVDDDNNNNDDDNGWNDRNEDELAKIAEEMCEKSQVHDRAKKILNLFDVCTAIPNIMLTSLLQLSLDSQGEEHESLFKKFVYHVPNILVVAIPLKEYMQFGSRKENHDHFSKDCENFGNEIKETLAVFPRSSRMHFLRYAQRATDRRAALNDKAPGLPLFFSCCGSNVGSRSTAVGYDEVSATSDVDDESLVSASRQSSRSLSHRASLLNC